MKSMVVMRLVALFERVIADLRDAIVSLERGDIDGAMAKAHGAGQRISDHATELANEPESKEGRDS